MAPLASVYVLCRTHPAMDPCSLPLRHSICFFHRSRNSCSISRNFNLRSSSSQYVRAVPEGEKEADAVRKKGGEEEAQIKETKLENIEALLGREFGGVLWFSVIGACLAVCAGGYIYFVLNFADFSDIPMIRSTFAAKSKANGLL